MDLRRIATRVASRFTLAGEPESMGGFHGVLKELRAVQDSGAQLVDLVGSTQMAGPELEAANKALSGFVSKWDPVVKDFGAEAAQLARTVGDAVVRNRRRPRG